MARSGRQEAIVNRAGITDTYRQTEGRPRKGVVQRDDRRLRVRPQVRVRVPETDRGRDYGERC